MTDFFISYRTADEAVTAVFVKHVLSERFGAHRVFFDNTAIPLGADFSPCIEQALSRCRALVAVIGPRWLARDEHGRRRLDDPQDWVRREIARVLARGVPVIPLLVGEVRLRREDLPVELAPLLERQHLRLRVRALEHDLQPLLDRLAELVESGRGADDPVSSGTGVRVDFHHRVYAPNSVFGIKN